MREGVLRPESGGGGKGNHRRFAFSEINLAAIFAELKSFGVSIGEVRKLSARFHNALDYMREHCLTRENYDKFDDFLRDWTAFTQDGYITEHVRLDKTDLYAEHASWILDIPSPPDEIRRGYRVVRVSWEQSLRLESVRHLIYGRNPVHADPEHERLLSLAQIIDAEAYAHHRKYWEIATLLNRQEPSEYFSTSLDYFLKDDRGEWFTVADPQRADLRQTSFIAIDIERLSYRMWGRE